MEARKAFRSVEKTFQKVMNNVLSEQQKLQHKYVARASIC